MHRAAKNIKNILCLARRSRNRRSLGRAPNGSGGIDLVKFNAADKMIEFEVMTRPIKALEALAGEIGNRIGRN
jgi:hypothetical protein